MMPKLLHVHGQLFARKNEVDEVVLVGNAKGLKALAAAIKLALEAGEASCELEMNDSEQYVLRVTCDDSASDGPHWPIRMHPVHGISDDDNYLLPVDGTVPENQS